VDEPGVQIIKSPMVGTFYRSPNPEAKSFVEEGSVVQADSVVCIIEAMKLMNEIESESSGTVIEIYAQNGKAVEYGQKLFRIKKA
jgi:acetyl-CoA carboxylase biotin carboxyl carrier protein